MQFEIAVKGAPEKLFFDNALKAGFKAIELYTDRSWLEGRSAVISLCRDYPFRIVIHAPNDVYEPEKLLELALGIKSKIIVIHNILWEDEWEFMSSLFKQHEIDLCIENTSIPTENEKIVRRYGLAHCLDLEHIQLGMCGLFQDGLLPFLRKVKHLHLTGYHYGSDLWHTHPHHSPDHSMRILNLISMSHYTGIVTSEAKKSQQTLDEFLKLKEFINRWNEQHISKPI